MTEKKQKTEAEAQEPAKQEKPAREKQNGVTRPGPNTQTGRVWEIADELSEQAGKPAARKDVLQAFLAEGGNQATGATQYGRWRKFYGLPPQRNTTAKAESEDKPEVETADAE